MIFYSSYIYGTEKHNDDCQWFHLFTRAFSLPCSTGAVFTQLVRPNSGFQLALDVVTDSRFKQTC
jgi:hypothetical protein